MTPREAISKLYHAASVSGAMGPAEVVECADTLMQAIYPHTVAAIGTNTMRPDRVVVDDLSGESEDVVHLRLNGYTPCEMPADPRTWPAGHFHTKDMSAVTCIKCMERTQV